jgi:two-component system cell cycle response regulator
MGPHSGPSRRTAAVVAALAAVYLVRSGLHIGGPDSTVGGALHLTLMLAAPAFLLHAAWRRSSLVWLLFGLSLIGPAVGEIVYIAVYDGAPPFPSWCDPGWLAVYPLAYVATTVLLRARLADITVATWLDGAVCGWAAAAVAAATLYGPLLHTSHDAIVAVAYPLGDLTLLAAVIAAPVMTGWRPRRTWIWIGAGMVLMLVADTLYNLQSANGTFVNGGLIAAAFPLASLLVARAAWLPMPPQIPASPGERRSLAAPALCTVVAFGLAVLGAAGHLDPIVMVLALGALALALVRAAITVHDHARLLVAVHDEAITDSLTGLGNRRRLRTDLARALSGERVLSALVLYDLNGFKNYNDDFGHAAGDALLARGGRALRELVAAYGDAYRLGGDEFCILIDAARCDADAAARQGPAPSRRSARASS